MLARACDRCSTRRPRSRAAASSMLVSRIADEITTVSTPSRCAGSCPTCTSAPSAARAVSTGRVLGVGAADPAAAGQHDAGHAGHAGTADRDEVHVPELIEVGDGRLEVEAGVGAVHRALRGDSAKARAHQVGEQLVGAPLPRRAPLPRPSCGGASASPSSGMSMVSIHSGVKAVSSTSRSAAGRHDVGGVEALLAVADGQRDVDGGKARRPSARTRCWRRHGRRRGRPRHTRGPSGRRRRPRRRAGPATSETGSNSLPRPVMCSTWMPAARSASTRDWKAVLSRCAPSEPPVTSSVGHCGSSPKCSRPSVAPGRAVEQRDLAAQRHADDRRPAQGGGGERRGHVAGEARARAGWRCRRGRSARARRWAPAAFAPRGMPAWRRSRRSRPRPRHRSRRWPGRRRPPRRAGFAGRRARSAEGRRGSGTLGTVRSS